MELSNLTTKTIRFILYVLNFVFFVISLFLIIYGSKSAFSNNDITELFNEYNFNIVGVFCILIGLCIFAMTFFGCWGALYENYSMLYTYGILLSVLLLFQLILYGLTEYLYKHGDGQFVNLKVENVFIKYSTSTIDREIVNKIQTELQCCGIEGQNFWKNINLDIPSSCSPSNSTDNQKHNYYYTKGCLNAIKDEIEKLKFLLPYIGLSLIIQILVIGATFYLAQEVKLHAYDYEAI